MRITNPFSIVALSLIAILIIPTLLIAQRNKVDTTISIRQLETTIVTANRTVEQEKRIPASVHSIQSAQIAQFGFRTTPEALQLSNGLFIQKTNHGGGSPFLRGVTGNQVLLLIDGIRLNNSIVRYGPNQYLNTIDAFSIKSIEVAHGTGSVQYGSDAIGGVIQVFTKEPIFTESKKGWKGRAVARYMTGDMEKTIRGEGLYSGKKVAAYAGITYRNFGDLVGGDTTGKQSPSGYTELAFDSKIKYRITDNILAVFAHQRVEQQKVPVYHKVALENFALNEMAPQQRILSYVKLIARPSTAKLVKTMEVIFSHQQTVEGRNSQKNGVAIMRSEKDKISTLGASADMYSVFTKNWTANTGVELYFDKVKSTRQDITMSNGSVTHKRGLYPDRSTYGNYSLYTLHHFSLKNWKIDAGLRYNAFSIRLTDTAIGSIHITPAAWVSNFSFLYTIAKNHHVFASFNNSYRAPNIDDMGSLGIVDFRYEVPAYDLLPEKSVNLEAGYKLRSEKWTASASLYYMKLKNIITRIKLEGQAIAGYPVYKKTNNEEAFIRGIELEVNGKLYRNLSLYATTSYTYGQNNSRNEPVRRIPPFNGRIRTSWKNQQWFLAAESVFAATQNRLAQGDKDDNRIPARGTPGWNIFNLYAGYEWKMIQCNMGFQNLLNKDYRLHGSGINGYGRSAWITIAVQL